jgi:hypothetical protein
MLALEFGSYGDSDCMQSHIFERLMTGQFMIKLYFDLIKIKFESLNFKQFDLNGAIRDA